ncbi:MAG: Dickkopf N-terminal cysteine-rich domain-containing protein [Myxococcota bacterium]
MLRLQRYARWSLASMVVVAAGCEAPVGVSDPGPIEGVEAPSASAVEDLIADHCEQVAACSCEFGTTPSSCDTELSDLWEHRLRLGDEQELTYDAECFDSIAADIQQQGCGWIVDGSARVCDRFCAIYHGERALGDSCESFDALVSDCEQGLLCSAGNCVTPCSSLGGRAQGETCSNTELGIGFFDDCADGLYCSFDTGRCQTASTEGQFCGISDCVPGLWCDRSQDLCVPVRAEGESCINHEECGNDMLCRWSETGDNRSCVSQVAIGQSCANNPCEDGLLCSNDVCRSVPLAGEQCIGGNCAAGATCDFQTDRCVALPVVGETCLFGTCAPGSWCLASADDPEGTCNEPILTGEMCSGHNQCDSGYCPNGFCWPLGGEGDDCENGGLCTEGLVCNGLTCELSPTRTPAVCSYPGW